MRLSGWTSPRIPDDQHKCESSFCSAPQRPLETLVVIAMASFGARLCYPLLLRWRQLRLPRGARWPMPPKWVGKGEEEHGPSPFPP